MTNIEERMKEFVSVHFLEDGIPEDQLQSILNDTKLVAKIFETWFNANYGGLFLPNNTQLAKDAHNCYITALDTALKEEEGFRSVLGDEYFEAASIYKSMMQGRITNGVNFTKVDAIEMAKKYGEKLCKQLKDTIVTAAEHGIKCLLVCIPYMIKEESQFGNTQKRLSTNLFGNNLSDAICYVEQINGPFPNDQMSDVCILAHQLECDYWIEECKTRGINYEETP